MKKRFLATLLGSAALFMGGSAEATHDEEDWAHGKLELGPAYMHVEFLQNGVKMNSLDLYGLQGNASIITWKGLTFKVGGLYGRNDGVTASLSGAVGWTIPVEIKDWKFYITPNAGYTWGYLRSTSTGAAIDTTLAGLVGRQGFHNSTPFVATDISFSVTEKITHTTSIQYAWTRSKVTYDGTGFAFAFPKTESRGLNLSSVTDYWFTENYSLNLAVGVQKSQSKEKTASRAWGARIGAGYYF